MCNPMAVESLMPPSHVLRITIRNRAPPRTSNCSTDKDYGLPICRVCHCVEPDLRGESALGFLGIAPPSREPSCARTDKDSSNDATKTSTSKDSTGAKDDSDAPRFLEFISPEGEIFVCATVLESGLLHRQDDVVTLGCSCKNELALAHYALKWFISHGSTVCEICGNVASNVRPEDFNKVLASLKDYEALRERTSTGDLTYLHYGADTAVDSVAVAAIRRQRLCEISSWFNPHNSHVAVSQEHSEQQPVSPINNSVEHSVVAARTVHTRWSLEGTGVFVALGLGFVVLAWLVAPHVGKKAAAIANLSSFASWRFMLVDYNNLTEICFSKNPVWIDVMLGNLVHVLVPRLWSLGFTNSQHTLLMIMEYILSQCEKLGLRHKATIHSSVRPTADADHNPMISWPQRLLQINLPRIA